MIQMKQQRANDAHAQTIEIGSEVGKLCWMDRSHSRRAIPPRTLAIVVGSVLAIGGASIVFMAPTIKGLFGAPPHVAPSPAAYASYDLVSKSANDAFLLVRPPGGRLLSASGLYRTTDAGTTWHRIPLPALPDGVALVVSSLPGGKLFLRIFGLPNGAQQFYTGDGTTWTTIPVPDEGTGSLQMIDVRLGFYVVTQTAGTPSVQELAVYRTQDGGDSWEPRVELTADHPNAGGLHLSDDNRFVTFSDATHGWLVAVPPSWAIVCGATSPGDSVEHLMASNDGGASWSATSLPALPQGSTELSPPVFPNQGSAGFLTALAHTYIRECPPVGTTYVYGTRDGGATWVGPRMVPGPYFDSPDGILWWASDGHQMFRSTNEGQSWKATKSKLPSPAVTLIELFAVDAQTAWSLWSAGTDLPQAQPQPEVLLRTTDAGEHWSSVKLPS